MPRRNPHQRLAVPAKSAAGTALPPSCLTCLPLRLTPLCAARAPLPPCSLKTGRVVIILQGRFAGRKAVIVQAHDDGHGDRKFGHAVGTRLLALRDAIFCPIYFPCAGGPAIACPRCSRLPRLTPPAAPCVAVAGVDKAPKRVAREMSKKKFNKRTSVKPFVKYVNYNHLMPTRYNLDVADKLKGLLGDDTLTNEEKRKAALKTLKTTLDER